MGARRRIAVRVLLALPLVSAPLVLAVREPQDTRGAVGTDRSQGDRPEKGRKVAPTWNASSDDTGVTGYDLYRNGTRVASPAGTSDTDRPGRGTFSYQVRARDAAGNVSGLSTAVSSTT